MGAEKKKFPKIRFEGFESHWLKSKLGNLTDIKSGTTPSRQEPRFYENGTINWIKTTDLNNYFLSESSEKITDFALKNNSLKVYPENTLFLAMYGGFNQIGRVSLMIEKSTCNQALSALIPKKGFSASYLLYFLINNRGKWKRFAASSRKDPNITKSDVEDFLVTYPIIEEQTQIGNFFQKMDEVIGLQQKRLALTQDYKKSMLQKMFPQKGEKVPRVRFGGFSDEWRNKKLSDLGYIQTGTTPTTSNSKYYHSVGMLWITPSDINSVVTTNSAKKLSPEGIKVARVVESESILITCIASIGKTTMVREPVAFNQQINSLTPDKTKYYPYFLLVQSYHWSNMMKSFASKGMMQIVNKSDFSTIPTLVPCLAEQTAIGNFFQKLDEKIEAESAKLEKLQVMKKAMLQRMFV